MTNPKVVSPTRPRCMDPGALSALVEAFTDDLTALGHTRLTVSFYAESARHFAAWLGQTGLAPVDIDGGTIGEFARHDCCCGGSRRSERLSRKYVNRACRFVRFLAERGIGKPVAAPQAAASNNVHVAEFQEWLKVHRGISERTIGRHGRMVLRLLPALGTDPGTYDARLVRHVILEEAGRCSRAYVKTMTMALRGYLRFLAARGLCRPGLDHAIPTIPQWRLSALPRYITSAEVERVIASCDVARPQGVRDRAILLLLARLGLRAGDILDMRFDDIDWREGTLSVRGKARREIRLPLPQDAGDALLDYLRDARPQVACDRVFLRSVAPHRALSRSSTVSSVVRHALEKAGINDAPSQGAHLLRHSAATSMLRSGATLDTIGTILRHRSLDTTAHYAKVDIVMLQQVAQPWPGGMSC